jgi:hypothetical protein
MKKQPMLGTLQKEEVYLAHGLGGPRGWLHLCLLLGAGEGLLATVQHGGWYPCGSVCRKERAHGETGSQSDLGATFTFYNNLLSWEVH